jgi:hypothetical protein
MGAGRTGKTAGTAGGTAPEPGWPEGLEFEDDFLDDPVLDPPPEAYADDLGLSAEVLRELRAGRQAARAKDEAVTAAWMAGTLEDDDEIPGLIDAAYEVRGTLAAMTDAEVIGIAVKTQEAASRLAARRYAAESELMRRRPARYWDRRQDKALRRRGEQDGIGEDPGAPALPGPVLAPTRELVQELMLALNWTQYRAEMDTARAAALIQRMPTALTMLRDGTTDDEHVRALEEALRDLSDEDAARVDAQLSPRMGAMTTQDVREATRRTVIRLDPEAAERRRKRNEKKARAVSWANDDHTATFALERIPAADAAAMKARVGAIARAAKSAGSPDPIPLLEAKTGVGLILGTLPYIPPPAGNHGPDGGGPDGGGAGTPGPSGGPADREPSGGRPEGSGQPEDSPPEESGRPAESPADGGGSGWTAWPPVPDTSGAAEPGCVTLPPGLRPAQPGRIRLLAPWRTLAGLAAEPGELSWFGVITPGQARELAAAAARDRTARWQVIVTDDAGRALEIADIRRPRTRRGTAPGLTEEVTLTITASLAATLARNPDLPETIRQMLARREPDASDNPGTDGEPLISLLTDTITIANQAAAEAELRARLDTAAGGCAHTGEIASYTVGGKLRRWITIRDRTCRNPMCRRRATQCDLDHTIPYDKGGRSCSCDLGAECRVHHQLKQLPGWALTQDPDGTFTWTTPAGLAYRKEPHRYPV